MDILNAATEGKVSVSVILLRCKFPNVSQGQFWVNKHKRKIAESVRTRHNRQELCKSTPTQGSAGSLKPKLEL